MFGQFVVHLDYMLSAVTAPRDGAVDSVARAATPGGLPGGVQAGRHLR